jgi:hypothetical protein
LQQSYSQHRNSFFNAITSDKKQPFAYLFSSFYPFNILILILDEKRGKFFSEKGDKNAKNEKNGRAGLFTKRVKSNPLTSN